MKIMFLLFMVVLAVSLQSITSDKIVHGWGCMVIGIGTFEITENIPVSILVPTALGVGVEYFQKNNPKYGQFDNGDLIADFIGVLVSIPFNYWLFRIKKSPEEAYRRQMYKERYGTEYPFNPLPVRHPLEFYVDE